MDESMAGGFDGLQYNSVRLVQRANALLPIDLTLLPIVKLERFEQPENAVCFISMTLSGILMSVSPKQERKADVPIETTLFGIEMLVRLEHPLNADWLIKVMLSPIMSLVKFPPYVPNSVLLIANSPEHPIKALRPIEVTL